MNYSAIAYILGSVLQFEAVFMLLPFSIGMIYKEQSATSFLISAILCMIVGMIGKKLGGKKRTAFFAKEGFVTVALSWIFLSIFGALPFYISREIPSYVDALFETVSGFTTTGASILSQVESMSECLLFWRSFTHWIGGMGVLVFVLAILPMTGGYNMHLMRAESPGPQVGKLVPKIHNTAMILYGIYVGITIVELILLLIGKMPFLEAMEMAFGTAGTGGFGVRNDSAMGYSPYIQTVLAVFMILFGINFNVYYLILIGKVKQIFKAEEAISYLIIIAVATLGIAINVRSMFPSFSTAAHHALFQVASVMTTTGFSTVDFNLWPETSRMILMLLMFCGACAGSTAGGLKVSRVIIYVKMLRKELRTFVHPRSVKQFRIDGRVVPREVQYSAAVYLIVYLLIYVVSLFLISFENNDFETSFTAVLATFNNIGPGFGKVGPVGNFGFFNPFSKLVLIIDMLAGRLELFPMLVLFSPKTWKK